MKILIVEDEKDEDKLLRMELQKAADEFSALEMDTVPTAEEAKRLLRQKKYDAVVADLNLLDSKGLDTVQALLDSTKVPVLVYTGVDDPAIITKATKMGVADFIPKQSTLGARLVTAALTSIERGKTIKPAEQILLDSVEKMNKER